MKQSNDIENILSQSSSSYGSLDGSSCSNLQQHAHQIPVCSSSSSRNDGLSMHQGDKRTASATSTVASATNAANDALEKGDPATTTAFGSDAFQNRNESADEQHHHDHQHQPHHPAHQEHLAKSRQYYRDMVLGVNDGLVSTFLLVAGVVGGGMEVSEVLLTSISGAIAGAISMFAGEYVATKSQNEVMKGEIKLEHDHIKKYHAEEMQELTHLLSLIGIPGSQPHLNFDTNGKTPSTASAVNVSSAIEGRKLRRRITRYYASNPDALLKIMIALEFGVIDEEVRSPVVAGGSSFILFFLGALPSTIPFACIDDATMGLIVAGLATGIGLFVVGAVKTWATRGNMWMAALENLFIAAAGGAIAYGIGAAFQSLAGE